MAGALKIENNIFKIKWGKNQSADSSSSRSCPHRYHKSISSVYTKDNRTQENSRHSSLYSPGVSLSTLIPFSRHESRYIFIKDVKVHGVFPSVWIR